MTAGNQLKNKTLVDQSIIPSALLEAMPDVMFVFNREGRYLAVLSSDHNLKNLQTESFTNQLLTDIWPADQAKLFMQTVTDTFETEEPQTIEYQRQSLTGLHWFEGRTHLFKHSPYGCDAVVWLARDITERKNIEALREKTESQLNSIYELGFVGFAFSLDGKQWYRVNQYLCDLLEYTEAELLSMQWPAFTHPDDINRNMNDYDRMLLGEVNGYSLEKRYISKTGKVIPVQIVAQCTRKPDGTIDYVTTMVTDISEQKRNEAEIRHLAYFDSLTNLPNRRHFSDRLSAYVRRLQQQASFGAVMFIDLDNFKTLNDTLGHEKGDLFLIMVASRLSDCIHYPDIVARQGGDEFVVLLENIGSSRDEAMAQCHLLADKLLSVLSEPYYVEGLEYNTSASIGIALVSEESASCDELLKHADIAMYQAKNKGRNMHCFFDQMMQDRVSLRAELSADMRIALRDEEFRVFYQPQVNHHGMVVGAEALVRWFHTMKGMISPAQFIPLAEETGMILSLGHWVLKTACLQLADWEHRPGFNQLTIAVNVSAKQIYQSDFVDRVLQVLDETGANPARLKLELTESLLLQDIEDIIVKMTLLKRKGLSFSLDDFGTGYSSLAYLKRLPLDQLKIDQSFVRDLLTDPNDNELAKTIVTLAESFNLNVIAEGVETIAQRDRLATHGCFTYQGYLFGRPVPIEDFSLSVFD